jgi:hypothetical protein
MIPATTRRHCLFPETQTPDNLLLPAGSHKWVEQPQQLHCGIEGGNYPAVHISVVIFLPASSTHPSQPHNIPHPANHVLITHCKRDPNTNP